MNELLKKVSLSSMVFMLALGVFGSLVPNRAMALSTGDLVKGPNSDAVYYINGSMKHVFPDAKTYFTWYSNFDAIQTVTVSELDQFSTGAPVAYRPGTNLVTHPNTANVYAVEPGGNLRRIPDEATALALYGANWGAWVRDVHELTFGNYTVGSDLTSSMHAEGTLLQATGDSTIYYFDGTDIRPFADSTAFNANNLNFDYVVEVSSLAGYSTGSSVTGAESFATISGSGTGTVTGPAGTVSVSLSPNTPGQTVLIGSSARVPMTTVRFTTGANPVTVNTLTILRGGVAQDGAFADFDLLDGTTMLPLNSFSKSLNSQHMTTFNDDFTIPANTSWDVIVAANTTAGALSSYAGEYPVISVTDITLTNNSTLTGTLPIAGNTHLVNGTLTAGTATVANGSNNPTASTKEVGTNDFIVSSIKITNNSSETNQTMTVKSITFTNNGSTAPSDVENLRLVNTNTGQTLATVATVSNDKITFNNLNLEILKGNNINLDLRLDIKSGSARTISYDIDRKADIVVYDNLRGVNVLPSYPNSASPYYNAPDTTVGNGKLRIESLSVNAQSNNIPENANGVLIGRFKFVAEGEPINIKQLGITATITTSTAGAVTSDLTNLTMKNPAGTAVAGPKDPAKNSADASGEYSTATTTDTVTVPVGETIYDVYGDLSNDFNANDTVQVGIYPGAIDAEGTISGNTVTATPSGQIQSTQLTVKSADLDVTVSGTPAAQTLVAGSSDVTVANIVLNASQSGSDVRVTSFSVPIKTTGAAYPDILTGLELFVGGVKVPVNSTSQSCSGASCSTAATNGTTTLSITAGNLTVPKGQTKTVEVKGDIGTGATSGTFSVGMQGGGLTAIDAEAQTFTADVTNSNGQAMTLSGGGTLNIAIASDPIAALAVANTTVDVGKFSLEAKNEDMLVNGFGFEIKAPDGGIVGGADEISMLELWEQGGSKLGEIPVNTSRATITPSTAYALARNANKTLIVKTKLSEISDGTPAEAGAGFEVKLSYIDVDGSSAGSSSVTLNGIGTDFKTFNTFETVPTVARVNFSADNVLPATGDANLFKFSVSANSAWYLGLAKFTFGVSTSNVNLSASGYRLYENGASSSNGLELADTGDCTVTVTGANAKHLVECRFDVNDDDTSNHDGDGIGDHYIIDPGDTKYFTLTGNVLARSSTNDAASVSTELAGDAGYVSTSQTNFAAADGTSNDDFIWSDLNFGQYATPTATRTAGWFNGYRVSGLDNTSTTAQSVQN